jgi:hypothetical protein
MPGDRGDGRPVVKYYTIHNALAAAEYYHKGADAVGNFLRVKGYDAYATGITHAGYSQTTAIPVAYALVERFAAEDALALVNDVFPSLGVCL